MTAKKDRLDRFLDFLNGYNHTPSVASDCEFGDHWWCDQDDWRGYDFRGWVDHVVAEFEAQ